MDSVRDGKIRDPEYYVRKAAPWRRANLSRCLQHGQQGWS